MYFLNWLTTKEFIHKSKRTIHLGRKTNSGGSFCRLQQTTHLYPGAFKTILRSADWEVKGATFLVTERKNRCITGLELQGKVGISTTQKPAPRELSRFDVLMCEQSEGWKNKLLMKFNDLIERQEISKKHIVSSKFKYTLCPIQEKRRRKPIHIQDKVEKEIKKVIERGSYYLVE